MKKTDSNFSERLSNDQCDDIEMYILSFVKFKDFDYYQCIEYFKRGSDTSSDFLQDCLEKEISWFDYKYATAILDEIDEIIEFFAEDVEFVEIGTTETSADTVNYNEDEIDWNKLNGDSE